MSKVLPTYESLPSHVRAWIDRNPYLAIKGEIWYWEGTKEACEEWIAHQEEKGFEVIKTPVELALANFGLI